MKWDFALIKKFSSTSHSRLLNQVRNELKSSPICRTHIVRELNDSKPINSPLNIIEENNNQSRHHENNLTNSNLQPQESTYEKIYDGFSNEHNIDESESKLTFRDRLKTVDLR
tara:strand:+ start:425 stop:763 length:339 start_codon:yes stop_codon:yes gene_type:complete